MLWHLPFVRFWDAVATAALFTSLSKALDWQPSLHKLSGHTNLVHMSIHHWSSKPLSGGAMVRHESESLSGAADVVAGGVEVIAGAAELVTASAEVASDTHSTLHRSSGQTFFEHTSTHH